jgi:hypothetical protein
MGDGVLAAAVKEAALKQGLKEEGDPGIAVGSVGSSSDPEVKATAEEAFAAVRAKQGEGTAPAETKPDETRTTPAEGAQQDQGATSEGTATDVPEEYFGISLAGLSAEDRASAIAGFKERDTFINQLLRDKASEKPGETQAAPAAPSSGAGDEQKELTDEVLAKALGLDLEDPYDAKIASVAIPLARQNIELKSAVEDIISDSDVRETQNFWETSLDALEKQFGDFPVPEGMTKDDVRLRVYEFAAESGIGDPSAAYWSIMGPARADILKDVQKRKAEALTNKKRAAAGTTRPATAAEVDEAKIKSKDLGDAVKEAAEKAAKNLGIDWEAARQTAIHRS